MAKISFIMSVFNTRQEWIDRSVVSVKNQTDPDWELIIVDDGSKQDLADYLDTLAGKDTRIKIHHQKNQGLSVARNYGMDSAKGKWVAFLDADDWLENSYIEKVMNTLNENMGLEILAFGHDDIWGEDKHEERLWGVDTFYKFDMTAEREGIQMSLLQEPGGLKKYPMFFGAQWKMVYSLEFLNKFGIRNTPGLYKAQDSVFNLYVSEHISQAGYYNVVLYHYFHNNESVTGSGFSRDLERFQKLLLAYKKFIVETGKADNIRYLNAYKKVALIQFEAMLHRYFLHIDNPDRIETRKQKMKNLLCSEPYSELLQRSNGEGLGMYRKALLMMMKLKNYRGITFLYTLKRRIA